MGLFSPKPKKQSNEFTWVPSNSHQNSNNSSSNGYSSSYNVAPNYNSYNNNNSVNYNSNLASNYQNNYGIVYDSEQPTIHYYNNGPSNPPTLPPRHSQPSSSSETVTEEDMEKLMVDKAIEISVLTDKIATLERRITDHSDHAAKYQSLASADWQKERTELNAEIVALTNNLSSVSIQLAEERSRCDLMRLRLDGDDTMPVKIFNLERDNKALMTRCAVAEAELAMCKNNLAKTSKALQENQVLSSKLSTQFEDSQLQATQMEQELIALRSTMHEVDKEPAILREKLNSLTNALKELTAASQKEKADLIAKYEAQISKSSTFDLDSYYFKNPAHHAGKDGKSANFRPPPNRDADEHVVNAFNAGDPYSTCKLDAGQLVKSLDHGPWPPTFELKTCKLLLKTFNRQADLLTFEQFDSLWKFISDLKTEFCKYDASRESEFVWGLVPADKLYEVMIHLNLKHSQKVHNLFLQRTNPLALGYDWNSFVYAIAIFQHMITEFDRFDVDEDRCVTLLLDQFLDVSIRCI